MAFLDHRVVQRLFLDIIVVTAVGRKAVSRGNDRTVSRARFYLDSHLFAEKFPPNLRQATSLGGIIQMVQKNVPLRKAYP